MLQRKGAHGHRTVFIDDCRGAGVVGVELHLVVHPFAEEVQLGLHELFQFGGGIDVHGGSASQQSEGGEQSDESEAVVAVEVGDEDVVQPGEFQP